MRFTIALFFAVFSIAVFGQQLRSDLPENNGMSSERLANINAVFSDYVAEGKLPGAVVLTARNGKIVYHQAIGMSDIEEKNSCKRTIFLGLPPKQKQLLVLAS